MRRVRHGGADLLAEPAQRTRVARHAVPAAIVREAARRAPGKKQLLSAGGVQEGEQALRILHIHGMELRRQRPKGFK